LLVGFQRSFFYFPVLASFFKQPVLKEVIRITAVLFIFLPLQMQYSPYCAGIAI